jgi:hypothetical protein
VGILKKVEILSKIYLVGETNINRMYKKLPTFFIQLFIGFNASLLLAGSSEMSVKCPGMPRGVAGQIAPGPHLNRAPT